MIYYVSLYRFVHVASGYFKRACYECFNMFKTEIFKKKINE